MKHNISKTNYILPQALIVTRHCLPLYFQAVQQALPPASSSSLRPLTQAVVDILTSLIIYRTQRYAELLWVVVIRLTIGSRLYIHLNAVSSLNEIIGFDSSRLWC